MWLRVKQDVGVSLFVRLDLGRTDEPLKCVCTQVRSRGLPDDHAGPIRIIDIEGVDTNMCCGTHVSNLSHLQVSIME